MEAEQNGEVSGAPWLLLLQVRHVSERNERQENLSLMGGLAELFSRGGLLGVHPKSHNVPHLLGIEKFISI